MTSIDIGYPRTSELNQQIYQNLKQALWLQLRRQVFLAVCDDLGLRDSLVAILPAELTALKGQGFTPSIKKKPNQIVSPLSSQVSNQKAKKEPYPPLVTIDLNIKEPNPINQIGQWLIKHPTPDLTEGAILPIFQILGVENLTRQPPEVQWSFLRNLREIESSLSALDLSLLLWIPRPWLNTIEHSAPEFWRCRTKVFEFEGEPTLPINKSRKRGLSNNRNHPLHPPPPPPSPRAVKIIKSREPSLYPLPLKITELDRIAEKRSASLEFVLSPKKSEDSLSTSKWKIDKEKFTSLVELVLADISENLDNEEYNSDNFWHLEILQELQQLLGNAESEVLNIALAFEKLGNYYRDRLSAGNVSIPNFTIAIHAYELLLELIIPGAKKSKEKEVEEKLKKSRDNWSIGSILNSQISFADRRLPLLDIFNDLGTVYWMLFRQPGNKSDGKIETLFYLERAIALYQIAASKIDKKTQPETYVRVQKNLGMALGDLARHQEPAENLCRSVVAYQEAVLHCNLEANPQQYAATLNNLGAAYWNLAQYGQAGERLLGAISAYSEALRYSKAEEEPLNYGMLQNNLATAYWNLSQIEGKVELLLKAIEAYNEALKYRTPDRVPAACAATNNNLGTAYWHLASAAEGQIQQKLNYLQEAIAAYARALKLARPLGAGELTFDVLAANNNLGLAHYQLATETASLLEEANCRSHLEAALKHHLLAYTGWEKLFASPENQSGKPKSQSEGTGLAYIVKTIRAFYDRWGLEGQNFALSKLPGDLLPEILRRL
ncbi:MAG: tetratricopeptide repeat protein [Cyanobacteriota bacterium]|nr:tetratricopeptide repeat protein [Cyanobacteriota bacterium]